MRVAFLITGLGVGGAERVVVDLADELRNAGHDVLIVFLTGIAAVRPASNEIELKSVNLNSIYGLPMAFMRVRRILKDFRADVVHSHMSHANILARLVRLSLPMKFLVCTAHSNNEGGRLRMLAYRITDRLADISTNVSSRAVEEFEARGAVGRGRMRVVHNGISCEKFEFNAEIRSEVRACYGVAEDCTLIVAVGRLTKAKDYPNLINSVALLAEIGCPTEFILFIAGDGPLRGALESMVEELGLRSRVRFLGLHNDIPGLISASDIFVLSSAWEGFGLVVAEAMACERVVVATDCGGVAEVLGDCGYLVQPRSSEALASALDVARNLSAEKKKDIGARARERILEFYSLRVAAKKWLEIYFGR